MTVPIGYGWLVLHTGPVTAAPPEGGTDVAFVWDDYPDWDTYDEGGDADSYILQVGTVNPVGDGNATTFNSDVTDVLTYTLNLNAGTYYSRVKAVRGGSPVDARPQQQVTVP